MLSVKHMMNYVHNDYPDGNNWQYRNNWDSRNGALSVFRELGYDNGIDHEDEWCVALQLLVDKGIG